MFCRIPTADKKPDSKAVFVLGSMQMHYSVVRVTVSSIIISGLVD